MNRKETNFKVVGTPVPRADGVAKVSGRTRYAADVDCQGALWAKILRSPYPHAKLLRVDVSKARSIPGVKAIVTGEDAKSCYIGKQIRDMPVLCWDVVRFIGDRVAAIAAETCDAAEEAISLIDVEYEQLPAVYDPRDAMKAAGCSAFVAKECAHTLPSIIAKLTGRPAEVATLYSTALRFPSWDLPQYT